MDFSILRNEIEKDTYKGLSDSAIAAMLNSPSGNTVTRSSASKADVLTVAQVAILNLAGAKPEIQAKWFPLLTPLVTLLAGSDAQLSRHDIHALDAAIADGLLTSEQANGPWTKTNSSAGEVLFGADFVVSEQQIGDARNGQ